MKQPHYLVVAATAAETKGIHGELPVLVTGLGKTAAAVATARMLAELPARQRGRAVVLNVGTAGALHDGIAGVRLPSTVFNHDINAAAVRALGYDPQETLRLRDGDGTVLASGDVFVADPAIRARLAEDADLVDMEGYAVTLACQRFDVPVRLIKHVSDNADESAMEWPDVVAESAEALGTWLADNLG